MMRIPSDNPITIEEELNVSWSTQLEEITGLENPSVPSTHIRSPVIIPTQYEFLRMPGETGVPNPLFDLITIYDNEDSLEVSLITLTPIIEEKEPKKTSAPSCFNSKSSTRWPWGQQCLRCWFSWPIGDSERQLQRRDRIKRTKRGSAIARDRHLKNWSPSKYWTYHWLFNFVWHPTSRWTPEGGQSIETYERSTRTNPWTNTHCRELGQHSNLGRETNAWAYWWVRRYTGDRLWQEEESYYE